MVFEFIVIVQKQRETKRDNTESAVLVPKNAYNGQDLAEPEPGARS